jgi:PHD/YefM family antitoxin component YafN of YafNO toxin-antitoxin module
LGSYSTDEMFSATQIVRKFGPIFKDIVEKRKKRAVIVKNNKIEAVLIPIDEYEKLNDAYGVLKELYEKKKEQNGQ